MIMKFENGIYVMYGETNYTVAHIWKLKELSELWTVEYLTQSHGSPRKFRPVTFTTPFKIVSNETKLLRPEA